MRNSWVPSIVQQIGDFTIYLVENDFGRLGRAFCEADTERADLETTIRDLLAGQYS